MSTTAREQWKSSLGFAAAAAGSAVGLVNIWRFPYIVGQHGGAAFIAVYILFLSLIGFPVLISEVLIGRTARRGPATAFSELGGKASWSLVGKGIALTGFIVSAFYSVVAGWILGYFILALFRGFVDVSSVGVAEGIFRSHVGSAGWTMTFHALFMTLAVVVLSRGVRRGIEWVSRLLMPLLIVLLGGLALFGLTLEGGGDALAFLFRPDWSLLTPIALLTALGHAFFTLSLGQGTMITYGSYLSGREKLVRICLPIVAFDTLVSLLAGVAVISLVFAGGGSPNGGEGLLFYTLPAVFGQLPGGQWVAIAFFGLVVIAALTSQTSAMEPMVSYLTHAKNWRRSWAVAACAGSGFILGIPCALSFSTLGHVSIGGQSVLGFVSFVATDVMIPLGGLAAVLFVGWKWGFGHAARHLSDHNQATSRSAHTLQRYLYVCVKYAAPVLIALVLLANLGIV